MNPLLALAETPQPKAHDQIPAGQSHLPEGKQPEKRGLVGEALQSAAHTAIQKPISAATQFVDKALGTDLLPKVQLIDEPAPAPFMSADWHAQQVGNVAGMLPWILVARKGARGLMMNAGLSMEAASVTSASMLNTYRGLAVTEGALTGFLYETGFTPVSGEGDFISEKLKHGAAGAIAFGGITAGTIGINTIGRSLAEGSLARSVLTNQAAAGGLSAIPAGIGSGIANPLILENRAPTLKDIGETTYGFAFIGTAAGAAHAIPGSKQALVEKIARSEAPMTDLVGRGPKPKPLIDVVAEKGSALASRVDEFAWSINPLRDGLQPAYAMADGRGIRSSGTGNTLGDVVKMEMRGENGSERGGGRERKIERRTEREERREQGAEQPIKASEALEKYGQNDAAEYIRNNPKLRNVMVKPEAIGFGNDAQVVLEVLPGKEFPHGAALKVVIPEGGWDYNFGKRARDAEVLGKVRDLEDGSTLYFQELVEMRPSYDREALDKYFADLEKAGLSFEDPGSNPNSQIGISRRTGQLVTVDYSCVGEPGHRQFLTDFNYGREEFEAETDPFAENKRPSEEPVLEEIDYGRERAKQDLRQSDKLDPTQREILDQLMMGISVKETAEYVAYVKAAEKGTKPDVAAMTLKVLEMEKMARSQGLL
ncbi:MAG: hypothetical protein AB7V06_07730 [Candidatus Obscuribacterales bacterium]